MANFLFTGGKSGSVAYNLDQIRYIERDQASGTVKLYFSKEDFVELSGESAKQFMDIVTRLSSEASRAWEAAQPDYLQK